MQNICKLILAGILTTIISAMLFAPTAVLARSFRLIDDSDTIILHGNVHALARPEFDQGATRSSLPMERMVLTLQPSLEKQAELDSLLAELHDPLSSDYHRWITPEEFGERFGQTSEDIELITRWLTVHGFVVEEVAKGRNWIDFSGTAADVERAFHTQIHDYYIDGQLYHANAQDPSIPRDLMDLVEGIVSLYDFPRKSLINRIQHVSQKLALPDDTSGAAHYMSPGDFSTIYNVDALYNAGIDGTGQSIAIVGRTHPSSSDWTNFRSMMGLPANQPQVILNGTDPGDLGSNEDFEADLDVEWSGAVARNANIIFVVSKSTHSTDGVDLSAQYVVNKNLAPVMSTSFGSCESEMTSSERNFYNNLWQQAASQGITSFVASGDAGVAGCNVGSDTIGSVSGVNGLASTTYNVAVGGTQFNEGSGTYWDPTNGGGYTSAISYIPEIAWNESGTVPGGSDLWSTGGGVSSLYSKPAWQASPGVPADGKRDIPDVSLTAAAHDAYLVESQGGLYAVSGTSASAPSFGGFMALIVQKTGQRQGNANTRFYQLGNAQYGSGGATVFHDITSGNNSVPGVTGYVTTTGYDLCTGLGSVDAHALVNNWTPDFTISASPVAISIPQGAIGTSTISTTVFGNFSNVISLSASGFPEGVTATFSPPAIPAPGSGSSILTITVGSSTVAGTYPVTVTGVGGSAAHKAAINLTVVPMFTVAASVSNGIGGTISPATSSVLSGRSVALTISPAVGYHLAALIDNGADVTTDVIVGSYTITNMGTNHVVVATFAIDTFAVNASANNGGAITPVSTYDAYGTAVTFTIIADNGFTLSGLTDNGVTVAAVENPPGTFTYTIDNITTDQTVQATFSPIFVGPAMGPWGIVAAASGMLILALRSRERNH